MLYPLVEIINFIIGRCDPASGRILQTIDDPVGVANFLRKESKLSLKVAIKHHWCQKTAETSGGQLIYDKCNNSRPNYQPNCIREADIEKIIDLTAPGEVKAKGALDAIRQPFFSLQFFDLHHPSALEFRHMAWSCTVHHQLTWCRRCRFPPFVGGSHRLRQQQGGGVELDNYRVERLAVQRE